MATMILGREIIARTLKTGNIRPYLDMGLDLEFMQDALNPAYASVFQGQDIDAWTTILRHYEKYGKVMETSLFRKSYPPENYRLVESSFDDRELTDLARDAIGMYETQVGTTEAQRFLEAGDSKRAAEIMLEAARKVLYKQAQAAITVTWDRKDFDLEERLNLRRENAPGFGIDELDRQFPGFQRGQLITFLGRAKAGKTTFMLQSAFHAWHGKKGFGKDVEAKRVLFVSTEVPEEDIRAMLTCYGAGVNPAPYIASTDDCHLSEEDKDKIRTWWKSEMSEDAAEAFAVVQPMGKFTISDLEYEIEKFEPDIVYVDGFYFLTDSSTGSSPGSNAFAHDNLARELKNLAMRERIPVLVSHQAREKQLGKAGGGLDDISMMGGTGLRMASDMVFTFDKGEDRVVTIKNTAARRGYVTTVKGEWDWEEFQFSAYEAEDDDEDY